MTLRPADREKPKGPRHIRARGPLGNTVCVANERVVVRGECGKANGYSPL
jgi:hypothetical protein